MMKKLLQQTLALTLAMGILASGMPPETALAGERKADFNDCLPV